MLKRLNPRVKTVAGRVVTGLSAVLVLAVLMTPGSFISIPVEALLGVAAILLLPARPRRIAMVVAGILLGLLAIVRIADVGFTSVLDRPFDPVLDWFFLDAAYVYLTQSVGRAGATAAAVGAVIAALALVALFIFAVLRVSRFTDRHRGTAARTLVILTAVWIAAAAFGIPVAAHPYYDRLAQVGASLRDRDVFAVELATDRFRNTPGSELLTALRGKDVVFALVESYGRVALEDPTLAPIVGDVLADGGRRLTTAGYAARSGFLTSPTAGGGSWLAHATLFGGVWVNNQQRYDDVMASDRLTLNAAFRRAGWRAVGVMPGVIQDWPEGKFFGNDQLYGAHDLGYRGPNFSFATMPDQYTLSAFQRLERGRTGRAPLMADIPLISSHAPWNPVPELIDWHAVGDGSGYAAGDGAADPADVVLQRERGTVLADYGHSIGYSLSTIVSYVETYGDDNLVLVLLGDHQPAPVITGGGANRDVPITILTRDRSVLQRVAAWGWQDGLKPAPDAPVWRMDAFRDRFLDTFA